MRRWWSIKLRGSAGRTCRDFWLAFCSPYQTICVFTRHHKSLRLLPDLLLCWTASQAPIQQRQTVSCRRRSRRDGHSAATRICPEFTVQPRATHAREMPFVLCLAWRSSFSLPCQIHPAIGQCTSFSDKASSTTSRCHVKELHLFGVLEAFHMQFAIAALRRRPDYMTTCACSTTCSCPSCMCTGVDEAWSLGVIDNTAGRQNICLRNRITLPQNPFFRATFSTPSTADRVQSRGGKPLPLLLQNHYYIGASMHDAATLR